MINRYTLPEMGALWTEEARFKTMLEVTGTVKSVADGIDAIAEAIAPGRGPTDPVSNDPERIITLV